MGTVFPQPTLNALPLGARSLYALTDEALFAACGVRVAFTGRDGGVSAGPYASLNTAGHVGDDLQHVARNRGIVFEAMGAPDAPFVVPNQVHGTDIVRIGARRDAERAIEEAAAGADGVVVRAAGVGALLNFADCLPLVIVAPDGSFAVVHAGWRGALAGIAGKAARALAAGGASESPADAAGGSGTGADATPDMRDMAGFNAYIGPHIRSECFETSAEIAARFADAFGAAVLADARHVSLARAVAVDLMRTGMDGARIADCGICTVRHSDRYFSYRASGGTCGRHAAAAIRT